MQGSGAGTVTAFSPATVTVTTTAGRLVIDDVSGDGDLDLIVTVPSQYEVDVLVGNGAGGFTNPITLTTEVGTSGRTPFGVFVADIEGEMGLDIITANSSTSDVSVIRSTGSATFAPAKVVPAVFGGEPATVHAVASGDFNGDGHADLVTANAARSTISIIIGFGNGNFAAPQTFAVDTPSAVDVGDFDGDGLDDVLVGNEGATARIAVFLGKGHP